MLAARSIANCTTSETQPEHSPRRLTLAGKTYPQGPTMIRIRGNAATLADIRGLLAVATDPEIRTLLEACLRMRGVA